MNNMIGKVVGGVVFAGAVAAIWLWPPRAAEPVAPEPVRPVRSIVVQDGTKMPDLEFPGVVKAGADRTLAFEVPGKILSIPVSKNQRVKKGDVIAKLDPKDFEDRVFTAKAVLDRDLESLSRYRNVSANAVSKETISRAEAQVKTSQASYDSAKRDLDRTVLTAPFDGVIADTFPSELDVVPVGSKIALILDTREIAVEVSLPETIVIRSKMLDTADRSTNEISRVVFDSYPGRSFPSRLDEFTAIADSRTQIYKTTFKLANVPELMLLPGMSATVFVNGKDYVYSDAEQRPSVVVPGAAVAVDEKGGYFVWKLLPTADEGIFEVRKTPFEVASRVGTDVVVRTGVKPGDRIATAGVSVLSEGRRVTLLKDAAK